jgi:tetratricopeptide (TPR) repeat protein
MSKLYEKAAEAVKKRNYDYAIELFIQELTLEPNNVDARKALRAAELRKCQEAGQDPSGGGAAVLKGMGSMFSSIVHGLSKSHEKVMLDCEQFLKKAPRHAGTLLRLAEAARSAGHIETAILAFEELRETERDNVKALRGLAQLWKEKSDINRALVYYENLKRVLPTDPEAAKAVRDLAASGATKKVEDAKAAGGEGTFRDVLKDKDEASRLEEQQKRARTEGDVDAAIKRVQADLQKNPGDSMKLLKQLGELYMKKKDFDKAVDALEKAYATKKDPQIADMLGDIRLKRFEEQINTASDEAAKKALKAQKRDYAIDEYRRRVNERPTELAMRFKLGEELYSNGMYDEAIAELQKAAGDPRYASKARLKLGKAFAKKGLTDMAVKELDKARSGSTAMDEITMEITYTLGQVHEKAGKKDRAIAEYEKIVEHDIGYKDAMKRIEALKA